MFVTVSILMDRRTTERLALIYDDIDVVADIMLKHDT